MSDPFKDRFDTEGLVVNPLAPSEVRRRGDRLRRRRNAAGVVAGVAAVALVATPISLFAGGDGKSDSAPAPPSGDWVTTIPDDFPLTTFMPAENPDGSPVAMTDAPGNGIMQLFLCDQMSFNSADAEDVATARYGPEGAPGSDDMRARTLALYSSDVGARDALDDTAAALASCPSQVIAGREHVYADQGIPIGEQSVVYTHRTRSETGFDDGVEAIGMVRVGNGVVVASIFDGTVTGDNVDAVLADFSQSLLVLAGEMCIFAEVPCAGGSGQQVDDGPSDIPAGFPLDLRQRAMVGDGGVDLEPSEDVVGIAYEQLCGAPIWTMDYLHRIGSMGSGPEFSDIRELRTYVSTDEAAIQMDAFLTAVHDCPTYGNQVITPHDADTGQHSITWSRTYTEGLGSTLFQATRVGRAVLVTAATGEGSLDSIETAIPEQVELTRDLAAEMCVFTEEGCGGSSTGLSLDDVIAPDETQPRYESAWETAVEYTGEGEEPASPCFGNTFAGRNAVAVVRRDFVMNGPQGPIEGDRLTAVVAEFPDVQTAQAAFIGFGEDAGLCEDRMVPALAEEYGRTSGGRVPLENVDGEARTWFATYGPYPGSADAVYRLETGIAWVGNRVVVMTSMLGPFEPVGAPEETAMEAMVVQAAERLLPGPNGPITEPPVMP